MANICTGGIPCNECFHFQHDEDRHCKVCKAEPNALGEIHPRPISDSSRILIEDIKHALFDADNNPQAAEDGTTHNMKFHTFVGDGHSFIVNFCNEEYRVTVTREI